MTYDDEKEGKDVEETVTECVIRGKLTWLEDKGILVNDSTKVSPVSTWHDQTVKLPSYDFRSPSKFLW